MIPDSLVYNFVQCVNTSQQLFALPLFYIRVIEIGSFLSIS
jgi:hypothetical protein